MASMINLKETNIVRYSPMEKVLFKLLQKRSVATTDWLTEQAYKILGRTPPRSSRIVIAGALRSLIDKIEKNREPFKIIKGPAAGPHSTEFRIEL